MDLGSLVLNISSDEEDENRGVNGGDDYSWISELLDEVDKQTTDEDDNNNRGDDDDDDDDDDDVVVVEEKDALNLNPKQRLKPSIKDLDDDCMILDGDPDKPVEIQNNQVDESDELLVVSEKGQVACRDYPHARHLCAAYPFNSFPHESHCDQCHCYVCDSRVPCQHWGTGVSYIDHCHATDKDEFWVLQRKSCKNGEIQSPKPILKPPVDISISTIQPHINNQVPPSILVEPNYVNPVAYRPITVRPNPNLSHPNIINPNNTNNHRSSSYVVPRNRLQTNLVLQNHSNGYTSYNNSPRGGRNLSPHSISQRPVFKRSASFGSSTTTNRHVYSSSNNAYGSHFSQNPPRPVLPLAEQNPYWTNSSINGGFTNQPRVLPCQPKYLTPRHQSNGSTLPSVNTAPVYGSSGGFQNLVSSQSQAYNPQPVSVPMDSRKNIFGQESQTRGGPVLPEFDMIWVNPHVQMTQTTTGNDMVLEGALQADTHSHLVGFNEPQFSDLLDPDSLDLDRWILDSQPVAGSNTFVQSPEAGPVNSDILFNF